MSEIPEDLMRVADLIAADIPSRVADVNRGFAANVIARAILAERMAERERCAKVVEAAIFPTRREAATAADLADVIRNQGQAVMDQRLTPRERDFLERVRDLRPLQLADRRQDRIRQRLRKRGLAAVVMNPRRWVVTEAGMAALADQDKP